MPDRVFGDIPDYPEDSFFESRLELSRAGVHRPTMAGISGTGKQGADSIVLSGGYEDDSDLGDMIVYTGHGGRDPETRQQVSDQLLMGGNLALAYSCMHGLPVRVIRGAGYTSPYSPPAGYRYDGLYRVEDYWRDTGVSGYTIWRFRLVKLTSTRVSADRVSETREPYLPAARQETTVVRIGIPSAASGRCIMTKVHSVESISSDSSYLYLTVDGQSYRIRWDDCSPRFRQATFEQRKHLEVSPSGYGIHWPEVDEDLAITPLLQQAEHLLPEAVNE